MGTYVFNFVDHFSSVVHVLEQSLDGLLSSGDVVEVLLGGLLFLLETLDLFLDLVLLGNGFVHCLDVEDFALDPVVDVEVRVLHALYKGLDLLLDGIRASFSVFGVSENHFAFLTVDVNSKIQLLIFIKHLQRDFVVVDTRALSGHIGCYVLLHGLEQGQYLSSKMRELLALLVKLVFLNRVVQVVLNGQTFSHSVNHLVAG